MTTLRVGRAFPGRGSLSPSPAAAAMRRPCSARDTRAVATRPAPGIPS
ncbi:hypothetical protein [Arsenicicoccus dermatophilus]